MRLPVRCRIRRNFLSGIQIEFKQSPHQRSLRAQLYWLQVLSFILFYRLNGHFKAFILFIYTKKYLRILHLYCCVHYIRVTEVLCMLTGGRVHQNCHPRVVQAVWENFPKIVVLCKAECCDGKFTSKERCFKPNKTLNLFQNLFIAVYI